MLRRSLLAIGSGLLLSVAFEPLALPYVIPFAVAGFVIATRGPGGRGRLRGGFWTGLLFGAAFYFVHIFWMRAVGVAAWIALSAAETFFYGVMGLASTYLQRHRWWPLWFASAWTAVEVWRSGWPFSGMPWGRLAFGVVDTPAAQALPYTGAVGVSFLLALLGAYVAWLVAGGRVGPRRLLARRSGALAGVVALCALFAVPALWTWHPDVTGHLDVAAVQGDVPGNGDDILYDYRQVTQNHVDATVDLAGDVAAGKATKPAFVVWPENSTAVDPFRDQETNTGIWAASAAIKVPIVVGAIVDGGPDQVLNQGIVWDPVTGAGQRYTKWHPVPYGEYIPFRKTMDDLGFSNFGGLAIISRDMLSGSRREPLEVAGVKVADAICFDVAYDDGIQAQMANGAQLMIVQSSNATFIHTDQIDQQFAITRLRALETGRYVAVATTNGVSGIIAPDGSVLAEARPQTQTVLNQEVGLVRGETPAMRIGPWAGRAALALTVVGVVCVALTYRRPVRRTSAPGPGTPEPERESITAGGPA